jgi:transcriptional regulator with XRE-family HTH domain
MLQHKDEASPPACAGGQEREMAGVERSRSNLAGRKIRQLRREHNLTQAELSSRIGIQQSALSRMEKGEYRASLDTLLRILAELDVPVGDFFEELAAEVTDPRRPRERSAEEAD